MSVIENALQKLRRTGAAASMRDVAADALNESGSTRSASRGSEPTYCTRQISVDLQDLRAAGYLPEPARERLFADCYREIKRPVIHRAIAAEATADQRLIMVTSALPGEGKTFTAVNLALSIGREHDVSVLLVDADLPKSEVSRIFGVYGIRGLLDALSDTDTDAESLVLRTDIPGLEIMASGTGASTAGTAEHAAELIASSRMGQVAARLSLRNPRRLVLFDSPPLLVSSEARALVQIPGQVLLVTRSGQTPQQALLDAIAVIDKHRLHGLVLNDAHLSAEGRYYYGYGYGSARGKGAESTDATQVTTKD